MSSIRWWTGAAIVTVALGMNSLPCRGADDDKTNKDRDRSSATSRDNGNKDSGSRDNGKTASSSADGPRSAMLGVRVEELHAALSSHLPGSGAKGQGLLVESVGKDSPAFKAGIKTHDILMTYDDQKLFTPEQFIKLVSGDKIGREVSLGLIREGKAQSMKVQLGERTEGWHHGHHPGHAHDRDRGHFGFEDQRQAQRTQFGRNQSDSDNDHDNDHALWGEFDSLTLKKLDKDRFHASVAHTDKDGKLQKHEYEGTRDEIRKKIESDKDLMPIERFHLVRGLDLHDGNLPDDLDF